MVGDVEKKPNKPVRWVRVALFVSLAQNLVVVGVIAGMVVKGPPLPRSDRSDPALPYTRAFDEDQRRGLRQALRQTTRRDGRAMRAAYLADYQRALALLRSAPFDPAALEVVLQQQGNRAQDVRARGQDVLMAFLTDMSIDDRRAYADRLELELEKMRARGGRDAHKSRHKDGDHRGD